MSTGFLPDSLRASTPTTDHESASEPAPHVVGKPTEREPQEYAAIPEEAPEAGETSAEAPDAGYGRCTESSDWEQRGRS